MVELVVVSTSASESTRKVTWFLNSPIRFSVQDGFRCADDDGPLQRHVAICGIEDHAGRVEVRDHTPADAAQGSAPDPCIVQLDNRICTRRLDQSSGIIPVAKLVRRGGN